MMIIIDKVIGGKLLYMVFFLEVNNNYVFIKFFCMKFRQKVLFVIEIGFWKEKK